jgi:DMSO/TMAO reductase YedYZ heme-binding membrane subunit
MIILLSLAQIIIHVVILWYIVELEKTGCECTNDVKRDIIKYITLGLLLFNIVMCIALTVNKSVPKLLGHLVSIRNLAALVNLIVAVWYYVNLQKKEDCLCSDNWKKHFLLGPIILQVLAVILISLMITGTIKTPPELKKLNLSKLRSLKRKGK